MVKNDFALLGVSVKRKNRYREKAYTFAGAKVRKNIYICKGKRKNGRKKCGRGAYKGVHY